MFSIKSTYQTSPNIAIVKYWGKRDEKLALPSNGSISFTLGDNLKTITTVQFSEKFKKDACILNGKPLLGRGLCEVSMQLDAIRKIARVKLKAKVSSKNNFPTGAGIASSASGFAALTLASCTALGLTLSKKKLSMIARRVSASASRSIFGGFAELKKGRKKDGTDSYSRQIKDENHWPQLQDIILIVNEKHKTISSREGMKRTVKTNKNFTARAKRAEKRIQKTIDAIIKKDSKKLFLLAMQESDDMHKIIEGSKPKIKYLNKASLEIISAVKKLNKNKIMCGYTFDAGPTAHILTLKENIPKILPILAKIRGVKRSIISGVGSGPKKLA